MRRKRKKGKVIIIGGGPGDPELLTIKAIKYLKKADIILYDRLAPIEILSKFDRPEKVYVGKRPGNHALSQEEINKLLVQEAKKGKIVVRLKGGDPYIFGRGEEECMYVKRHGIECIVVPGISSFISAAARFGIPLTNREVSSSFAVVTGYEAEGKKISKVNYRKIAESVDTIVIFMPLTRLKYILEEIGKAKGEDVPIAIISNISLKKERILVYRLGEILKVINKTSIESPALVIVGDVVKLHGVLTQE